MQRIISSHIEASKIGREIAEQAMDTHRRTDETSAESSDPDPESSLHVTSNDVRELLLL